MAALSTLMNYLYLGNYNEKRNDYQKENPKVAQQANKQDKGKKEESPYWLIRANNLLTVQHFSFHMERSRNETGVPYDPVLTTFMVFTVRFPKDGIKDFYTYMKDNGDQSFSFLWSPEFNAPTRNDAFKVSDGCMKSFGGAILVNGHVVDIDETLEFPTVGGKNKQLELTVKLLVSDMSFAGEMGNSSCELLLRENAPDSVSGFSKYALFLTDDDAPTTGVQGGITHSVSQEFGDDKKVRAILKNLWYHKRISQPCEIIATLTLTWASTSTAPTSMPTRQNIKDWFFHKRVQLKVVDNDRGIDKLIANNYFVYELYPCYRRSANTSSMDVELHMFSLDKLMTLDKYSKVYTSKRLGNDIFSGSVANFVLKKYPAVETNPNLLTLTGDIANMQVMPLATNDKELRIPYAVQYDESFYDFIKRQADRYGEFLYFEDGTLHLGLNPGTSNYSRTTQTTSGGTATTEVINWAIEKDLQARYYHHLDAKNLSVFDTSADYLSRTDEKKAIYAPNKDSDNNELEFFNPDSVPADENLDIMPKEGGITLGEQYKYAEWRKLVMWDIFKVFSAKSLGQAIADIATTELFRVWKLGYKYEKKKANFVDNQYTPYMDDSSKSLYLGHTSTTQVMQFGTLAGKTDFATNFDQTGLTNLTSVFFSALRKMEREVAEDAVTLEFGENTQPFSLGDKIQVDSIDYIIIDIEGRADKREDGFEDVQKVTAIPLFTRTKNSTTTSVVIPPLQSGIQIRESKPQRAFIVDTDDPEELGRVRIRYPWQKVIDASKNEKETDDASLWIRVTLPMATDGGAVNFTPGKGDEAMVDYENGNIDRPYVTGYVMSPYNKSKWGNPSLPERGIVSANGHSLTFDDGSDGSNFFWGWLPTLETAKTLLPPSWWGDWLKNKDAGMKALVGGFTLTDRYGLYEVSGSSDGRSVNVKSPMGDISLNAFTGIKISAPNGDINITGKNVTIKAGNKLTLTSGTNIKDRYIDSIGGVFKNLGLGIVNNLSEKTLESLLDFSFLRCVLEVFARPVDGTLKIKSNTHVMVEAGKGSVQVPSNFYNKAPSDSLSELDFQQQGLLLPVVLRTVEVIKTEVNAFVDNFKTAFDNYYSAYSAYMSFLIRNLDYNGGILPFNTIKDKAFSVMLGGDTSTVAINDGDLNMNARAMIKVKPAGEKPTDPSKKGNWDQLTQEQQIRATSRYQLEDEIWTRKDREEREQQQKRSDMIADYKREGKKMIDAIFNLRTACNTENNRQLTAFDANTMVTGIADQLRGLLELVSCPIKMEMVSDKKKFPADIGPFNDWDNEKKFIRRKIVYKMLTDATATYAYTPPPQNGVAQQAVTVVVKDVVKVRTKAPKVTNFADDNQWSAFIKEVLVADNNWEHFKEWAKEHYAQRYLDLYDVFARNQTWDPKAKGRILFSDNPSKTIVFTQSSLSSVNNIEALAAPIGPEISRILGEL